ncbi:MAG: hypothetical protein KL840_06470 [Aquamicrobium sp.]|nr:hypothetical protein [Aquamicrobium sp.]
MSDHQTHSHQRDATAHHKHRDEGNGRNIRDATPGTGADAERAAETIVEKAEGVADHARQRASDSISSLAESVRRASDEYRASDPGLLADLMGHAVAGIDTLARNVGGRSTSEMIGSAREFGRHNPLGLLLGGVAAGFAISRLAVGIASSPGAGEQASQPNETKRSSAEKEDFHHGS